LCRWRMDVRLGASLTQTNSQVNEVIEQGEKYDRKY
jgi:hypothetical protein